MASGEGSKGGDGLANLPQALPIDQLVAWVAGVVWNWWSWGKLYGTGIIYQSPSQQSLSKYVNIINFQLFQWHLPRLHTPTIHQYATPALRDLDTQNRANWVGPGGWLAGRSLLLLIAELALLGDPLVSLSIIERHLMGNNSQSRWLTMGKVNYFWCSWWCWSINHESKCQYIVFPSLNHLEHNLLVDPSTPLVWPWPQPMKTAGSLWFSHSSVWTCLYLPPNSWPSIWA